MKNGFRNTVHSFICLLLGLQLVYTSMDTSRFLAYHLQSYQQLRPSSSDNAIENFADLLLAITLEADNTSEECDESETGEEQQEGLDLLYIYPDSLTLIHVLPSNKGLHNHVSDSNLELIS